MKKKILSILNSEYLGKSSPFPKIIFSLFMMRLTEEERKIFGIRNLATHSHYSLPAGYMTPPPLPNVYIYHLIPKAVVSHNVFWFSWLGIQRLTRIYQPSAPFRELIVLWVGRGGGNSLFHSFALSIALQTKRATGADRSHPSLGREQQERFAHDTLFNRVTRAK